MVIMRRIITLLTVVCFSVIIATAQTGSPRSHSHNDYEQKEPFNAAYREGFNSIEADVWLVDGKLLVGHDQKGLQTSRTLEVLYLKPLTARVRQNKGTPYPEKDKAAVNDRYQIGSGQTMMRSPSC
jgi:hypothetical protein